jgi:putative DNA primase/helicase
VLDWEAGRQAGARPWPQKTPEELAAHRRKMTAVARWLWDGESVSAHNTSPVAVYLYSRLITMPPPPSLRLHWGLRDPAAGFKRPAMLGKVEHVEHGFTAVHITWLVPDGIGLWRRGARKTFGPIGGGAVRFGWPKPDRWLVVGEGIETTLSLVLSTGCPGWAALSARGLAGLKLPPEARQVLIAGDNDADGQKGARIATRRWIAEGRPVRIITPPVPGTDWSDVLRGRAPAIGGNDAA